METVPFSTLALARHAPQTSYTKSLLTQCTTHLTQGLTQQPNRQGSVIQLYALMEISCSVVISDAGSCFLYSDLAYLALSVGTTSLHCASVQTNILCQWPLTCAETLRTRVREGTLRVSGGTRRGEMGWK